ncbi:kynurenine 3-monooxygenase, mitochondrial precursor [Coemansia sp. RSA 2603]|nr:kynurenine 3-monooxygenase, mitochondrial precursor [Coemansia sp. RSA 2603]
MPWSQFEQVKSEDEIARFFRSYFPDALELMGEKSVCSEYARNPKGSLMYIKCTPYTYKSHAVILGDAAHAMVPFYGQGMNCGFEDVEALDNIMLRILHETNPDTDNTCLLDESQMQRALDEYSCTRTSDASAIVDLALENYIEMRSRVVNYAYLFRKKLEGILHKFVPKTVIPLYTMVSFTSIPYSTVVKQWNRQTKWLHRSIWALSAMTAIGTGVLAARLYGLLTEYPSDAFASIVAKTQRISS